MPGTAVKAEDLGGPLRYRHLENEDEIDGAISSALGFRRKQATAAQHDAKLRYMHLKDEDYDTVMALMHGSLPLSDIPKIKSKIVKLFISSTFTDMAAERNALQEQVFPKVRKYCRDKYGIDFQAVDMRWGVAPEAKDDHSTQELCLAELTHCQTLSIGPNFAVLLGQRYGHCPVPAVVPRFQFEYVRQHLENSGRDVTLLDQCYQRDANLTPSVYRLQKVSKITALTGEEWAKTEATLKELIVEGARGSVAAHDIKNDDLRRLTASLTEHEVYQGLIEVKSRQARENNCILFIREIQDLFDHLGAPLATRFCDLIPGTQETNGEAHVALNNLKDSCRNALHRFNFCFSKVDWTVKGIDPQVHKDHIDRLCEHFYHTTRALVDRNMLRHDQLASDELYHEVVGHWNLVASRCDTFVGREVPLMAVRQYIFEESSQAFVIHGESGVGKTSFLAKVASAVHGWTRDFASPVKTSVVLRFVGITPKCSSIQQLLHSVCHQIALLAGWSRTEVPEDYKSLKMYFIDLVQRGEVPGLLVIILDSLDQLSSSNGAHKLDWLPARIAPNVKVIVSTLPERHGILERLRNKVQDTVVQLAPLPTTDAERIMKVLLDSNNRQVTLPQWRIIQEAFKHCTLPLFIALTFQEASRWHSYDEVSPDALKHTVEAAIQSLFQRLETKHGKVFVSRVLAYITAARRGLSESELEDVLSLDDDVLNAVFSYWLPPVRRVPPSLWPRLYLDIATFLVERDADDVVILSWYHQQFVDAATSRYLSDYVDYVQVHRNIAEYYTGTWSGSAQKPFIYTKQLMDRLKLTDQHGKACRYVPDMPLVFRSSEVDERFNLRKMSQLPYSLLHSRQFDRLRNDCFCNYEWLHTKLRATSVQHVLADFTLIDDRETELVADVLRMADSALKQDPDRLGAEISGRLLPHIARYPAVRELVRQCDLAAQKCCPLVPMAQLYAAPGGPLQYECDLEARSSVDVDVFSSPDGILLTAKSYYSTCLKVWELSQGEPRQDLHLPVGALHPSSDGRYLAILRENRHVSIFKTDSGENHGHVDYEYGEVGAVATCKKYLAISVERGVGPIVVDLEESRQLHRFALHSHAVAFSPDETMFVFNSGGLVLLYTLPLMERKCVGQASDIPQQLHFTGRQTKCFLLTQTKMLQSILFDVVSHKTYTKDILCDLDMREFTMSHNENFLLCRSARCLYVIDAKREKLMHRLQRPPDDKVFTETMTTFSGCGFTPDDRLVVAARYNYLFVWKVGSGQAVRVLQAALSPIVKLFMSPATNKAVTLLKDNTLQVWNLNNLDADILHANEIIKGAVKSLAVSKAAGVVACHGGGQGQAEVKLVELSTGRVAGTLQQADHVEHVSSVYMPAGGRYILTSNVWAQDEDGPKENRQPTIDWPLLRCMVLWDMERKKAVFSQVNGRYAFFDRHGMSLGVLHCTWYSPFDWTDNLYRFSFLHLDSEVSCLREQYFDLPDNCEPVGCPVLFCDRRSHTWAFVAVLQLCHKTFKTPSVENTRQFETVLYIKYVPGGGSGPGNNKNEVPEPIILRMQDLIQYPDQKDRIANVTLVSTNLLLVTYVKGVEQFVFDSSHGMVVPPGVQKGSVLYDLMKNVVVKHNPRVLDESSDLQHTLLSSSSSIMLDQNLQVFDTVTNKMLCKVEANLYPGSAKLALDGRYLVGLTLDQRMLHVYRTSDGKHKGSLLIHGKATCLEVAEDDRTVAVGTCDGRIMLLSLVLEFSDPYCEYIQHLPSRNPPPPPTLEPDSDSKDKKGGLLLDGDAQVIRGSTPELLRLSAKIRSDVNMAVRKQPSFRSLTNAMTVAQRFQQSRSQACVIQ